MPKTSFGKFAFGKQIGLNLNRIHETEIMRSSSPIRRKHSTQNQTVGTSTPEYGGDLSWRNNLDPLKYRDEPSDIGEKGRGVAIVYPVQCPIGPSASIDEHEKVVLERTMGQSGYLDRSYMNIPSDGVSPPLTGAFQRFQSDHGLELDGVVLENGPTAHALGGAIVKRLSTKIATNSDEMSDEEQCDHLYWNVDVPTCKKITQQRGREAGGRCHYSAAMGYGACLDGTPIEALPPLDTWVWP